MQITKPLTVYLPDTRGVVLSRYGRGNLKIGAGVYTYSRLPGLPGVAALGHTEKQFEALAGVNNGVVAGLTGTCPGATEECRRICYAARPVAEDGPVFQMWFLNTGVDDVPPIPEDARILRLHISGDFDTLAYIHAWIDRLATRPDVTCWAYTRSWRMPELLPALEQLRALPKVQIFASMDRSTQEEPPAGWRRAWIDGDPRAGVVHGIPAHSTLAEGFRAFEVQPTQASGVKALICPEETKHVKNCEECGFCFVGPRNDVVFLEH